MSDFRRAQVLRNGARNATIHFLVDTFPSLFDSRWREEFKQASQRKIEQRISAMSEQRRTQLNTLVSRSSSGSSVSSLDFFLAMYTGNPMWIINPDIARIQFLFDLATHSSSGINPLNFDLSQAKQSLNEYWTNGSGATGEWEQIIAPSSNGGAKSEEMSEIEASVLTEVDTGLDTYLDLGDTAESMSESLTLDTTELSISDDVASFNTETSSNSVSESFGGSSESSFSIDTSTSTEY